MAQSESSHTSGRSQRLDDDTWNEIINEWTGVLRNSAMSQSTEGWNHLVNVGLPALRKILDSKL